MEQRVAHSMEQASRVTFWQEPGVTIVANRSLDPANVFLDLTGLGDNGSMITGIEYLGTVPPCIRLAVPDEELLKLLESREPNAPESKRAHVSKIYIQDSRGETWQRSSYGRLEPQGEDASVRIAQGIAAMTRVMGYKDVLLSHPSLKREALDACAEGS
ncbi:hypothetical protein [Streptomyces sp. NPDC048224]|uniref:hypothetical protein n=1 Tax=unclassified Streptomyces TaxID=2593676 RepID=UPI0033C47A6B